MCATIVTRHVCNTMFGDNAGQVTVLCPFGLEALGASDANCCQQQFSGELCAAGARVRNPPDTLCCAFELPPLVGSVFVETRGHLMVWQACRKRGNRLVP